MNTLPSEAMNAATTELTMDGYIRVSRVMGREGESYISPHVQREAIERWAEYKGVTIAEWHTDEDRTGGNHDRPGLTRAVARCLDGDTGGIVSWKIDRFSRHTESGLRDLERLSAADARLAFVVEDIDTSGPMGRFVYTIMLAMSTYFLDQIKAGWVTAKERAHARGAKVGPTPFGYRRDDGGALYVHEDEAAIVRTVYEYAARDDLGGAADFLTGLVIRHDGDGKRAGQARTWTTSTVRRLVGQRIYLGDLVYEGMEAQHFDSLAIVGRAGWEAAQAHEARRRKPSRDFPLSGIATCAQCGENLVGASGGKGQRTYRCRASLKSWKGERCAEPTNVTATLLEEHVRTILADALGTGEWVRSEDTGDLDAALSALEARESELAEFVADTQGAATLRRLGLYNSTLEAHATAVEEARALVQSLARETAGELSMSPSELLASDDPEALALVAGLVLDGLSVARGRTPLAGRVTVTVAPLPMPAVAAT